MVNRVLSPSDVDLARFTPDVAEIANLLWADGNLAAVLIDADRRLLTYNTAAEPSLSDEQVRPGGRLEASVRAIWLDDEVEECPPAQQPLERAVLGETTRRQLIRFNTASYQEQGRMRVSALPVALHDGSRGTLVCWQDITDPGLNQRRDRREIRRLEQLLEGASDYAILLLDPLGMVLTWSHSAERLHGYPTSEGVGLPFARLFSEAGTAIDQILAEAVVRGSVRTDGLRRRKDGSTFWAEGTLTVLRDESGDPNGFVEVAHDITEKRRSEQKILSLNRRLAALNQDLETRIHYRTEQLVRQAVELKATNEELESFSYSVSHNLRAPLRAIGGYARLFEDRFAGELPTEAVDYLHKLGSSAEMMGRLIDGLLELSRTQRTALIVEPLGMTELVDEVWAALAEDRADRIIALTVEALPASEGDRRLLYQVWLNLLSNAIKYTGNREESRIHVSADVVDGVTWYRVEDNGVGFDMRYAHKIGEVFERLHDSSEFPGTGIGMASVQRIVQRHGGTVAVHGEIGVGARMAFSLWADR
jgi:PAS domain S-box-containing protein